MCDGAVVQLGERLLCKQEVTGSIPVSSKKFRLASLHMKYFVYILKSLRNGRYYVGYTNDLTRRLGQHNSGRTKSIKHWSPFEVVYKEEYDNASLARKREYYIKSQKSRKYIENLIKSSAVLPTSGRIPKHIDYIVRYREDPLRSTKNPLDNIRHTSIITLAICRKRQLSFFL